VASIALAIVGSTIGGPIGGAIGAAIGSWIDSQFLFPLIFGRDDRSIIGPRLDDLKLQLASEGSPINLCIGPENRVSGTVIWMTDLIEVVWGGSADKATLFFTDHDTPILLADPSEDNVENVYKPAGGFDATARQRQEGLKARNLDARGFLSSDFIKHEDLLAGKYREAKVTEFLVDWRYPWLGPFFKNVYWLNDIRFGNEIWEANLEGPTRFLRNGVGELYSRTCRYTLYDTRCTVIEGPPFVETRSVISVATTRPRLVFKTLTSILPDNYFTDGLAVFLGSVARGNLGLPLEIRSHVDIGGIDEFVLHTPAPFDIVSGVNVQLTAGCDKTLATCRDKFNNLINHGGFPFIPGTDKMFQTPFPPPLRRVV